MADGPWNDYAADGPWKQFQKPTQAPDSPASSLTQDVEQEASNVVRPLAQGAISALTFIPDVATDIVNLLPGQKMELPSSYWNRQLDSVTKPPTTKGGRIVQGVSSFVAGGAMGGEMAAAGDVEKAAPAMARGVRALASKEAKPLGRVTTRAAEEAHTAGYNLPPSYIGGDVARTAQTVAGGPKLDKEFSEANESVTDGLAKLALGLHPDEDLTDETLERLKQDAYQPYEEVRTLGKMPPDPEFDDAVKAAGGRFAQRGASYGNSYRFESIAKEKQPYLDTHEVDSGETLDEIRSLRASAKANLRNYDPEKNALGYTQTQIATAMEDRIERFAKSQGRTDLVAKVKNARAQLAKIANVEHSIGAGGHVRAADFARMLDANVPLTGPLRTIAETAKNFPKAVQDVSKEAKSGVFSAVDYLLGGTGMLAGHPAITGASLARPLIRKALQSEGAQRAMMRNLRPQTAGGKIAQAARGAVEAAGKTVLKAGKAGLVGAGMSTVEDFGESQP